MLKELKKLHKKSDYSTAKDTLHPLKNYNNQHKRGLDWDNGDFSSSNKKISYNQVKMDYIKIYSSDYLKGEIANLLRKSEQASQVNFLVLLLEL